MSLYYSARIIVEISMLTVRGALPTFRPGGASRLSAVLLHLPRANRRSPY
jgi:hypothetical protein